ASTGSGVAAKKPAARKKQKQLAATEPAVLEEQPDGGPSPQSGAMADGSHDKAMLMDEKADGSEGDKVVAAAGPSNLKAEEVGKKGSTKSNEIIADTKVSLLPPPSLPSLCTAPLPSLASLNGQSIETGIRWGFLARMASLLRRVT
ncbi:hypothetical protein EUX98_g4028, partial [Antrodiella citrinella]